jgi:hypothetical protein
MQDIDIAKLFPVLNEHGYETNAQDNHIIHLIRSIIMIYLEIACIL